MYTSVITAQQLNSIKHDNLVIIDCRFQLADTEAGRKAYNVSHLTSAYYCHLDEDCSGPITDKSSRHPLPAVFSFLNTIAKWGITKNSQVVVYDASTGAIAARLWWMLKNIGLNAVAVLSGGFNNWHESGFPVSNICPSIQSGPTDICVQQWDYVSMDQMKQYINDSEYLIIDARAAERYAGHVEPIDPIAGHIPSAVNRFHGENFDQQSLFKPRSDLLAGFKALIGDYPLDHVIVYCGSGVTSCAHLVALEYINFSNSRLFAGSWSEWIKDPENPIIKK
ncbi:MAG: sulfurtransferase [Anaerolineaceae bacterium]|nr:sulfurtransferase [Anaerolineaceae bacterium]